MTTQSVGIDQIKAAVASKLSAGEIDRDQAKQILQTWAEKNNLQPKEPAGLVEGTVQSITGALKEMPATLLGAAETGLSIGTGMIAEPVAGLAGLGTIGLAKALGDDDPLSTGVRAVESVREGLTYTPKTEAGQQVSSGVSKALTPLGNIIQKTSEFTGDLAFDASRGNAAIGTAGYLVPEAILEALSYPMSKAAKTSAIRKQVEAGNAEHIMTPEVQALLEKQGYTTDEIARIIDIDPAQLERAKRFDELGIQPTRGDITQDTAQRKAENQLMETAEGEASNEMRQLRVNQSVQIENNLKGLVDETIDNEVLGASIKDALQDRKNMTEQAYKDSYAALAEAQKGVDVPVLIDDYRNIEGLPDAGNLRDIQANKPALYETLENVLAEFGLNPDSARIEGLVDKDINVEHVNLANFERLRKRLGNIEHMDESGTMGRIIAPIRSELDRQVDIATQALESSDDVSIANLAKEARQNYRASRLEFDGRTLADDLTKKAPRSNQPAIYASQVYEKIIAPNVPIEKLDDMLLSLKSQGKMGEVAIGQMQSNVIMDLLDSSLKGTTSKIDGTRVFSPAQFQARLDKLNKNGKLKLIFQDNPRAYKALMDNAQAMQDLTPAKLEIIKGSSSTMLDIVNTLGLAKVVSMVPMGSAAMEGLNGLSVRSRNRKLFDQALSAKPELKEAVGIMTTSYPALAAALGVGYVGQQGEEE